MRAPICKWKMIKMEAAFCAVVPRWLTTLTFIELHCRVMLHCVQCRIVQLGIILFNCKITVTVTEKKYVIKWLLLTKILVIAVTSEYVIFRRAFIGKPWSFTFLFLLDLNFNLALWPCIIFFSIYYLRTHRSAFLMKPGDTMLQSGKLNEGICVDM